ncbi:MAG TPA: TetR/AcrR family transcriptional regulator [Burkholderiales bacterium]
MATRAARAPLASDAKERLLDAAELLFAELGYASCTFREIAGRSGINQGLLHYYFGSKQNLFTEVFMRRAQVVASHRELLLDEAIASHGAGQMPVETLVRAFLTPALSMAQAGPGGAAFVRIHSQLRSEAGDIGLMLRRQAFGASTQRYVKALTDACPHLPKKIVYWRFNFMVGSYLVVSSQGGRLEDYSGGTCTSSDVESALAQLVPFVVAGFMAPAPGRKPG